jgi:hypothetical protein
MAHKASKRHACMARNWMICVVRIAQIPVKFECIMPRVENHKYVDKLSAFQGQFRLVITHNQQPPSSLPNGSTLITHF